ncbi:unnamed protein product [Camellia sinensis]
MDTLCSLLCSEAIHVEAALKQNQASEVPFAYAINRGHYSSRGGHRGSYRGRNSYRCRDGGRSRGQSSQLSQTSHSQTSHYQRGGPNQFSRGRTSTTARAQVTCQICGKVNHTTLECWHRLDFAFQPTQRFYFTEFSQSQGHSKAYVASTPVTSSSQPDSHWFLDSGATNHMTHDLSNMSLYQSYQGHVQVAIGDGTTLPIAHTGQEYSESAV